MILDGIIYATIALTAFLMTQWGSDEAGKFIDYYTLFWLKTVTGSVSATALSVKMFRSDTYSKWKEKQNGTHEKTTPVTPTAGTP